MRIRHRFSQTLLVLGVLFVAGSAFFWNVPGAHAASLVSQITSGIAGGLSDLGEGLVKFVLRAVLTMEGWLVGAAATMFAWVLEPDFFYRLMQNTLLYGWWQMVRDVFNMFFIAALLLTAFSTIFQVQRFHYSKTLIDIILMALFVNFSFPISRFIIDFFNRMMYFLLNISGVSGGKDMYQNFLNNSRIVDALTPPDADISFLIFAVIFMFLFMIALITLSILMLVRVIVLVLLVIFSPLGFAGRIMPGVEKYASQWWGWLFQYASFGPFAILMLVISLSMMHAIGVDSTINSRLTQIANTTTARPASQMVVETMAFLTIPIILMFYTIGIGKKMSIAFADMAEKKAKDFAKGPGLFVATYGLSRAARSWNESRKEAREDSAARWKTSTLGRIDPARWGKGVSTVQDKIARSEKNPLGTEGMRIDARKRILAAQKKKLEDQMNRYDSAGLSSKELEDRLMKNGDKASAALLGKRGAIRDATIMDKAIQVTKGDYGATTHVLGGIQKEVFDDGKAFQRAVVAADGDADTMKKLVEKITRKTFEVDKEKGKDGGVIYSDIMNDKSDSWKNAVDRVPELKKTLQNKMKESGAVKVAIDFDIKSGKEQSSVLDEYLRKMTAKDWVSQADDFYTSTNPNIREYASTLADQRKSLKNEAVKQAGREGASKAATGFWESIYVSPKGSQSPAAKPSNDSVIIQPGDPNFKIT